MSKGATTFAKWITIFGLGALAVFVLCLLPFLAFMIGVSLDSKTRTHEMLAWKNGTVAVVNYPAGVFGGDFDVDFTNSKGRTRTLVETDDRSQPTIKVDDQDQLIVKFTELNSGFYGQVSVAYTVEK